MIYAQECIYGYKDSNAYLYELDHDDHVLCRKRSTSDWVEAAPPESIDFAWLRVLTHPEFDESAAHVILGVLDSDGMWCESGNYKGESTMDVVLEIITHWMPDAVPRARIGT